MAFFHYGDNDLSRLDGQG